MFGFSHSLLLSTLYMYSLFSTKDDPPTVRRNIQNIGGFALHLGDLYDGPREMVISYLSPPLNSISEIQ